MLRIDDVAPPPIPASLSESFSSLSLPVAGQSISTAPAAATVSAAVAAPAATAIVVDGVQELLQWDQSLTQSALELTNGNRSARRPGSVSCYPAALIDVPINGKYSLSVGKRTDHFQSSG